MTAARNFHADLADSQAPEVDAAIRLAIMKAYPEVSAIVQACQENDRLGIDYWLEYKNGTMQTLDAKIRKLDYSIRGDDRTACIELVSNNRGGKLGWSIDPTKRTDIVLFYYIETGAAYFYPARELRAAIIANMNKLKATGKPDTQKTNSYGSSYASESLFVSHAELWRAIYRTCTRQAA